MSGAMCVNTKYSAGVENNSPLALASQQLPSTQEQLSKHQEGQFEWLLSIPVSLSAKERKAGGNSRDDAELPPGDTKFYFGCNLLRRRTQSGASLSKDDRPANTYTLLATRIQGEQSLDMDGLAASADQLHLNGASAAEPQAERQEVSKSPEAASDTKDGGPMEQLSVPQPPRPLSRIEDSVEELDKLEEEIEAVNEAAQLGRVASPETNQVPLQGLNGTAANATPPKQATPAKNSASTGTGKGKGKPVARSASVRGSAATTSANEDGSAAGATTTRKVARPASLLPPKQPAKSSKPPTVAAFELPGEAVARRLKEQREARRSQQITPEQAVAAAAAYSPSKPHVKSSKPPTRPTFELPGEAISRRKREEREAKLRAQEEEERKRREFKARPIRASLVPSSTPRETLASLARREKATASCSGSGSLESSTTPTPTVRKRLSVAAGGVLSPPKTTTPSSSAASQSESQPTRGRDAQPQQQQQQKNGNSRATSTSTSTGSTHSGGKRSTVSAEEAQQQKLRGKEIFAKDNSYTAERERERRDREEAARLARQEAAERSRMLSREWKEKQKRMKKKEKAKEKEKERERENIVVSAAA